MNRMWTGCVMLLALAGCSEGVVGDPGPGAVNAVVGDVSWVKARGRAPAPSDSEEERIAVHLAYVEGELRGRSVEDLSPEAQIARLKNLDALRSYRLARRFPSNDDHPDMRRPTFIDDAGRICAVGHLLAEDLGRDAAEAIALEHKYDYVPEIDHPILVAWASSSGLTGRELAMIQPSYDHEKKLKPERKRTLTRAEIRNIVRRMTLPLRKCGEQRVVATDGGEGPWRKKIAIKVTWDGATGKVREAEYTARTGYGSVDACVWMTLKRLKGRMRVKPFQGRLNSAVLPFRLEGTFSVPEPDPPEASTPEASPEGTPEATSEATPGG